MEEERIAEMELVSSYIEEAEQLLPPKAEVTAAEAPHVAKLLNDAERNLNKAESVLASQNVHPDQIAGETHTARAYIAFYRGLIQICAYGNRSAALSEFQKAVTILPDFGDAHKDIGQIKFHMGDRVGAVTALRRAVELKPDDIEVRKLLDQFENTSDVEAAISSFHGSWKVLFSLIGAAIFFLSAPVLNGPPGASMFGIILLACAFGYWRWKHR